MNATRILSHRTPLIHFIGKRSIPEAIDHSARAHAASPTGSLPTSFKQYREAVANLHGPLASRSASSKTYFTPQPKKGEYFDRNQLPKRFGRLGWSAKEIDAVESAGASLF